MDITVIIPSRGRPRTLSAALTSLHLMQSGKHKVTYAVACDQDDHETIDLCKSLSEEVDNNRRIPIIYHVGPRPDSLGGLVNFMCENVPGQVYTALCDDVLCASACWDDMIALATEKVPHGVFFWRNGYPGVDAFYAIITEKWRQAAGGMFTEDYPFWFDDLCLVELWSFTTDLPGIPLPVVIMDKPYKTTRMRDIVFWREFFMFTRPMRVREGFQIAKKLGLKIPQNSGKLNKEIVIGLQRMPIEDIIAIEKGQGDPSPPDEAYIAIKKRAEAIMAGSK